MNHESADEAVQVFEQIARSRRSIRGFQPQPVAASKLEQVFQTAAFAPSNCNTQPWQSHVVSGEVRDRLSRIFMDTIGQGEYSLDYPYEAKYEGEYRQRQLDVGILLYQALGVTREDKEGKRRAFLRNLELCYRCARTALPAVRRPYWGTAPTRCDVNWVSKLK
jgi:nitroreductase